MKMILRSLVLVITLGFAHFPTANASLLFENYVNVGQGTSSSYTLANEFTVGSEPLSVTRLGVFENFGFFWGPTVGIWRVSDAALVGSAVVEPEAGKVVHGWRFVDVQPFTLAANSTYRIGTSWGSADSGWGGTYSLGSGIAGLTPGSYMSEGWDYMMYPGIYVSLEEEFLPVQSFYANAEFVTVPVPEPSEWAMLVAGLSVLGFMARRRRSNNFA
jgi:hypothetical protein